MNDKQTEDEATPLVECIYVDEKDMTRETRKDTVQALLENRAAPNVVCAGETAMTAVAARGYHELISLLAKHGADVNYVFESNEKGCEKGCVTPLAFALISALNGGNDDLDFCPLDCLAKTCE
eukprot:gene492-508_t